MSKSQNELKTSPKDYKISVRGLSRHFFDTPGGEAREDRFETFLGFRGSGVWRLLYMAAPIVTLVCKSCLFGLGILALRFQLLGGRFGYFLFFSAREGEGREGGGGRFSIENLRGEGSPRGAEGSGGCLRRIGDFFGGGGGLNIFFRGRNVPQGLDGRNRAIVSAESLAKVVAASRIASVRWRSYLTPKQRN